MTERESAVEHLRNAQQLCRALEDVFHEKGLDQLARDVHHIELRIVLAVDEMQREVKELTARLGSTVEPTLDAKPYISLEGVKLWRVELGSQVAWYTDDNGRPGRKIEDQVVVP